MIRASYSALLLTSLGLAACNTQQPQYGAPQNYIVVQQPPPPPRVEHRPQATSPDFVWVDGYWLWDNDRYTWQQGHYASPPRQGSVWIAPRYDPYNNAYRYTPGEWQQQQGQTQNRIQGWNH